MTVANRLETCIITLMGLEQDFRTKTAQTQDEKMTRDFDDASRMIEITIKELRGRLRQVIRDEPQYVASDGVMAPWEGEIH